MNWINCDILTQLSLDYTLKLNSDDGHFMQVDNANVDLTNESPVNGSPAGHVMVTLQLIPVGCKVYNITPQRLLKLAKCILTTLVAIHATGFVHRDVRQDNIVETQSGFCLIDWELAGSEGELVFWKGQSLPSDVTLKKRPFVFADDLWQLGMTLSGLAMPTKPLTVYIEGLLHGDFDTAAAALDALPDIRYRRFGKKPWVSDQT